MHWKACASIAYVPLFVLAGCGAAQPPIGSPALRLQANQVAEFSQSSLSWMLPSAKGVSLLYVANSSSNSVDVYSYPKGKLQGTLGGFSSPDGECVDQSQNVWIVDAGHKTIVEYAHGGTIPIATLKDHTTHPPFACAVDPTTGNLAVVTGSPPYGNGAVLIFKKAKGSPQKYLIRPVVNHPAYDGYDNKGNLFVDGLNGSCCRRHHPPVAVLAELPNGGTAFGQIKIYGGAFYPRPYGIQWDGKYITVTNVNVIYEIQVSGSRGSVVGSTTLNEPNSFFGIEVESDWIIGSKVVASDYSYDSKAWNVGLWKYPAGGLPIQHFTGTFGGVFGVAVSLAK